MRISVVTATLNVAGTLADTIESVRRQTHDAVEHILIDGASRDGTPEIIDRYRKVLSRVVSEPDDGIYDAMNKGIALATGEVIGTLNGDDLYAHDQVLARVAQAFDDPAVQACYADLVYVEAADPSRIVRYWRSCPYRPGLFERGWLPAHPTFFVRREVYERYGAFDLQYRFHADFELTMRLLAIHGVRARYIPEVQVRMRMGGASNNSIANVVRGNLEDYRACKQYGLSVTPWFFVTKLGSRLPQFFRRPPHAGLGIDAG